MSVIIRGQIGSDTDEVRETRASAEPTRADAEDPLAGGDLEGLDFGPIPEDQLAEIVQRSHPFA